MVIMHGFVRDQLILSLGLQPQNEDLRRKHTCLHLGTMFFSGKLLKITMQTNLDAIAIFQVFSPPLLSSISQLLQATPTAHCNHSPI